MWEKRDISEMVWTRWVPSGQKTGAGTVVIWLTSWVKSCSLRFILKPWWFHFNGAVSDSFWNCSGFNVRVKNCSLHWLLYSEWNHCGFKMNPRLQYHWNHCGFKMNPRLQLVPAITESPKLMPATKKRPDGATCVFLSTWGIPIQTSRQPVER